MDNTRVMGFDVSSSTVGWAVFDIINDDVILFKSGSFKPIKKGSIFDKLADLRQTVSNLIKQYNPDQVAIEDIVKFMSRASSANTIIILSLYNRTVGLTSFDILHEPPYLYNVMSIRHGLKLTSELPKKEEMLMLVQSLLGIQIPLKYKKNGGIKDEIYDEVDAIACGLYHAFKITNKLDKIKRARK